MDQSLEKLRRAAKKLCKSDAMGELQAKQRVRLHLSKSKTGPLKHADYLHVIAGENGFSSWPQLKLAVEVSGMDHVQKQQRLKVALFQGQHNVVDDLLRELPDLADGMLGLHCALYNRDAVASMLAKDPEAAVRKIGPRSPILHLAFSKHSRVAPERGADMLAIAEMLVAAGADVNDGYVAMSDTDGKLSALYGAIGHADNMVLGQWLLDQGANPDDGESLYHACELPHAEGVRMLLAAGADPAGTNALLRALDFEDMEKWQMLIAAGAGQAAGCNDPKTPWLSDALPHAARRMRGRKAAELLLAAGADPSARHQGMTPYALARAFGNTAVAEAIVQAGGDMSLTKTEAIFAVAAEGQAQKDVYINPETLPTPLQNIIPDLISLPKRLNHIKQLVALGVEFDRPNAANVTPVQLAGWEGNAELLAFFISLSPDLAHINGYGGTLLSTIIHGSENCQQRKTRDHIACARQGLEHGLALPRWAISMAADEAMLAFLQDWAMIYPSQVTEH